MLQGRHIFLEATLEVIIALVPSAKKPMRFFFFFPDWGFGIFAENKLCGKHMFMMLTCFVPQDNLHELTPLVYDFLELICNHQD